MNTQKTKNQSINANFKKSGKSTINDIIKRSMTVAEDDTVGDDDVDQEYVPTMKEKFLQNQVQIPKYTLRYNDNFRMRWDMFIMVLAIYNCVSLPFLVAFEPEESTLFIISEILIDVCFAADIIIAFRTTYMNSKAGYEVVDGRSIAMNYIVSGRFFVDLSASVPFEELFFLFADIDEKTKEGSVELKLVGLVKLVRLLRLGRIIRNFKFKQGLKVGIRMF